MPRIKLLIAKQRVLQAQKQAISKISNCHKNESIMPPLKEDDNMMFMVVENIKS